MAFDFPSAPTIGQKYPASPAAGIPTYTWDGEKWTTVGGAVGALNFVRRDGDTMTGLLQLSGDPTAALHAATKQYIDAADAGKVAKIGDTMTGNLSIYAGNPALFLDKNSNGAVGNNIQGNTLHVSRWLLRPGNDGAETGGNVGSDFDLHRYADDGSYLGRALAINRANGSCNIGGTLGVDGNALYMSGRGVITNTGANGFNLFYDGSGNNCLYLGGSTDQRNYYRNSAHIFGSVGGGTTFGTFDASGAAIFGVLNVNYGPAAIGGVLLGQAGDLTVSRPSAPTTGVVYLGNNAGRYIFYNGTNYEMPGAVVRAGNGRLWGDLDFASLGAFVQNARMAMAADTNTASQSPNEPYAGAVVTGGSTYVAGYIMYRYRYFQLYTTGWFTIGYV